MSLLQQRRRRPEIMDQPDLDAEQHRMALRALSRINFLSHSSGILWPALADLAKTPAPQPPRILDVATGGGDVPIRLWQRAQRAGLDLRLEGCDISPTALYHARRRAAALDASLSFFEYDALTGPQLSGYDAIICSLFLHHLDEERALEMLRRFAQSARRLVLINDLERGLPGWLAAQVVARLITTSPIVHVDGPRSVEGAFTVAEARALAERAGMNGVRVERRWPFRWLLTWRRSP